MSTLLICIALSILQSNCLEFTTDDITDKCASSCAGLEDGLYQSCSECCNLFVICSNGILYDIPCASNNLVWNDAKKTCDYSCDDDSNKCCGNDANICDIPPVTQPPNEASYPSPKPTTSTNPTSPPTHPPITSQIKTCCHCTIPTPFQSGCSHDIQCENLICNFDEYCCSEHGSWDDNCASHAEYKCLETFIQPTAFPTSFPTSFPTVLPTIQPTEQTTTESVLTTEPSSIGETLFPNINPTIMPTQDPTVFISTLQPTVENSSLLTTINPTISESTTGEPTSFITESPTVSPTIEVISIEPTAFPTIVPTTEPTQLLTESTMESTTGEPVIVITTETSKPTVSPTTEPTNIEATLFPNFVTTQEPTAFISTTSSETTKGPTQKVTITEPLLPDNIATLEPTLIIDIVEVTRYPTVKPSMEPTMEPNITSTKGNADNEKVENENARFTMKSIDRKTDGIIAASIIGAISCVFCIVIISHFAKFQSNEKMRIDSSENQWENDVEIPTSP